MSILDTFFLLFEADSSKLEEGLDKARKKGKETAEGLRAVDVAANKLGASLGSQLRQLGGALLGAVAVRAMADSMFAAAEHADKLNESTERLGLNIETISAWGDAIKKNGGSVEGFIGSLEGFNAQLVQMEATGKSRAAPFLKELGIDLEAAANKGKTAMEFLPQIADAMEGLDKQKAQALGKRLGFDAATIMTLQAGRREVEAMLAKSRELGVITKEQGEIADKFGDQQDDTRHAFRSMWMEVATKVLPALTWLSEKFQNVAVFMRKHSDFIVGLLIALGAAIAFYVLPPLYSMAAAAIVAFAPFLLMGAIVAGLAVAFALLYDDVMAFVAGNDSLIGQILAKFPMIGQAVQLVVDLVKTLGEVFAWTFQTVGDLLQIGFNLWQRYISAVLEFSGVFELVRVLADAIGETFTAMGEVVGGVWDYLTEKIRAFLALAGSAVELAKGVAGAISGGLGNVKSALGIGGIPDTRAALLAGREQLGAASASSVGAVTSSAISNSRGGDRSVSVGSVTVQTAATDAAGISKSIGGALGSQLRQASSQFDDGVLA